MIALSLFSLRTGNHHQAASLSGMAQLVGYAIAAGPVAFGALRDLSGSWTLPLTTTAMLMLVLCVMAVLSGRNRVIRCVCPFRCAAASHAGVIQSEV